MVIVLFMKKVNIVFDIVFLQVDGRSHIMSSSTVSLRLRKMIGLDTSTEKKNHEFEPLTQSAISPASL